MNINFDGKRMNVTKTAGNGVVNHETIFEFQQTGDRVFARYSGGKVSRGSLIGELKEDQLRFAYVQEHADGKIALGHSTCEVSLDDSSKMCMIERFDWEQGKGENVFQELR